MPDIPIGKYRPGTGETVLAFFAMIDRTVLALTYLSEYQSYARRKITTLLVYAKKDYFRLRL
jgi:hypothetical protein